MSFISRLLNIGLLCTSRYIVREILLILLNSWRFDKQSFDNNILRCSFGDIVSIEFNHFSTVL